MYRERPSQDKPEVCQLTAGIEHQYEDVLFTASDNGLEQSNLSCVRTITFVGNMFFERKYCVNIEY